MQSEAKRVEAASRRASGQSAPRSLRGALRRDEHGRARLVPPDALAVALLACLRVASSLAVARAGLRALSDDDYARVVIAERFAASARFDASGTSWLPFPFWLTGSAMKMFGSSLEVARAVGVVGAVVATWLVYAGARHFGLAPRNAFFASALATMVMPALVLGAVPTPELLAAALAAFALLAATTGRTRDLVLAAVALFFATLSRYEAWPIALVVFLSAVKRAFTRNAPAGSRRPAAAALSLFGPLLWLANSRIQHGAWFDSFARVSSYRHALSSGAAPGPSGLVDALAYVSALGRACLTVTVPLAIAGVAVARLGGRAEMRRWALPLFGAMSLVVFLMVGALMGGAPTHHADRALVVVWLLGAVALVDLVTVPLERAGIAGAAALVVVIAVLWCLDLGGTPWRTMGTDRRAEEDAGAALRGVLGPGQRALVSTTDYGYFAVIAALGKPDAVAIDATHDPRTRPAEQPASPARLCERLRHESARWLVAPAPEAEKIRARDGAGTLVLSEKARAGNLAVYEAACQPEAEPRP